MHMHRVRLRLSEKPDKEQMGCVPCSACFVSSTESDELWALAFRAKPSGPADLTMDFSCCDKGMVWR